MLSSLNNREIATYFWLIVLVVIFVAIPSIRKTIPALLKALFAWKITAALFAMLAYLVAIIFCLQKVGFWNTDLFKDTIVWICAVGITSFFRVNSALKEDHYFREILKEGFRITVVVEFIVNLYVFALPWELLLIPSIAILMVMKLVSERNLKFKRITKLLDSILGIIGMFLIVFVIYRLVIGWNSVFTLENLRTFILPFVLLVAIIPFLYILALLILYEELFVRINYAFKGMTIHPDRVKQLILKTANFNLPKARRISKNLKIYILESEVQLKEAIREIVDPIKNQNEKDIDKA